MTYNVKLSDASIKELQKILGMTDGNILLSLGIIQITERNALEKLAGKFEIDSVNGVPYQKLTKKERKEIIGNNLEIGSVVQMRGKDGVEHVVIIAVDGNKYTVARLILSERKPQTYGPKMIHLKNGSDIIYRDTSYKSIVTLMYDITYGLKRDNFLERPGSMIVGKVINLELIQPIINLAEKAKQEAPDIERCNAEGE